MVFFFPGVNCWGYTTASVFWLWDVYLFVDDDFAIFFFELVCDVHRYLDLFAAGVCNHYVQIAATLARQFAKGVEGGVYISLAWVYLYWEIYGGRLCALFSSSEEGASCLVGDKVSYFKYG